MFWFDFPAEIQSLLNYYWWQINFLLLVNIVILGYLSIKKPIYACGLTIILLPTYLFRSRLAGLPFTYLELCLLVTFGGWLMKKIVPVKKIYHLTPTTYHLKYFWPILIILISSTIAIFASPDWRAAAGIWKAYFLEPILFFIVLKNCLKTEQDRDVILWALGFSTLVISLLAINQKFTGFGIAQASWVPESKRRVTAFFTSPNAVGLYLAPIVLICFGWLIEKIKNAKSQIAAAARPIILLSIIIVLALAAIIFTQSHGTLLGLAAGLAFFCFFAFSKKWTLAAGLLAIIITLAVPLTREKIMPVVLLQDASGQNRLMLWQMAGDYLLTSPKNFLLGGGFGGFAAVENRLRNPLKLEALLYPHHIFLNFWLEIGLLGLAGFIWLISKFFRDGFSAARAIRESPQQLGLMAAMVCIIVHGLIDVPYFKNDLAVLFWTLLALL